MHRLQAVRAVHGAGPRLSALAAAQLFRRHVCDARRTMHAPTAGATLPGQRSGVRGGRPVLGASQTGRRSSLQRAL